MSAELLTDITIFVLALLVGFEVISKVPATLHTPLMSAANSIHGIVLAGAMLIAVTANNALGYILAFRCGQQIRQINPTDDTPGCGVDASDEICLINVRP